MLYNCYKNWRVQRPYRAVNVAVAPGLSTGAKVAIGVSVGVGATGAATAVVVTHGGGTAGTTW